MPNAKDKSATPEQMRRTSADPPISWKRRLSSVLFVSIGTLSGVKLVSCGNASFRSAGLKGFGHVSGLIVRADYTPTSNQGRTYVVLRKRFKKKDKGSLRVGDTRQRWYSDNCVLIIQTGISLAKGI
jgi:hypothetical protein